MTRPIPTLVDDMLDVLDYLQTAAPSYHFAEDLTGWEKPNLWITLDSRGGSFPNRHRTYAPVYDFNVYAPTKPQAKSIALQVAKILYEMKNQVMESGAVCIEVECSYPADITDPINRNPRYVFDVTLTFRTP